MMTNWTLKIIALFHDPPEKTLGLEGHQRRAFHLMEQVLGQVEFQRLFGKSADQLVKSDFKNTPEGQRIKQADQNASAIDRAAFPRQTRLESSEFRRNLQVKHPFCGEPLVLPCVSDEHAIQQQTQMILDYVHQYTDPRKKYLALWRAVPGLVPDAYTRLLPPDTRIVDHTLWAHLDTSAALASALPEVAMLHVGVGPVKAFIYEARRTQDLWMGSYLLSFLTWAGIKVIAEAYGPDTVIYPSLRGQPLADQWLDDELGSLPPGAKQYDLTVASIPNKFVALLPASAIRGDHLPDRIAQAVRTTWREIAEAVCKNFPAGPRGGTWQEIWERQTQRDDWPEIYWSAVCWPDLDRYPQESGAQEALRRVEACLGEQEYYRQILNVYQQSWKQGVHAGTMYGALYKLLTRALDSRKRTRDFLPAEEDGEKCTVIPALSALRVKKAQSRKGVRQYWQSVARALAKQGPAHEIKSDGSERLSAVAAVKRFAQRGYFNLGVSFPSTSRVSAVPFYRKLFRSLPENPELQTAIQSHLDAVNKLDYPKVSPKGAEVALPALKTELKSQAAPSKSLMRDLLRFDADVLFPERLDSDLLAREHGISNQPAAEKAQATCQTLCKIVGSEPPTYYATLLMDGDQMGKWLSGQHEHTPLLRDAFHPDIVPKFQTLPEPDRTNWDGLLNRTRPLAANLHASLSAALAGFALHAVRFVVEKVHFGRVVYAGGDEMLALLPVAEAIPAAYKLWALFTGHARLQDGRLQLETSATNGFVEWGDEILMMPGSRITLSAGLLIAHHLYPLDGVLEAVRITEQAAKEVYGRNALCVRVLKRSGETLEVGSKWTSDEFESMPVFDQVAGHFSDGSLSFGFAYELADQARVVTALDQEATRAVIKRLVTRHKTQKLSENEACALVEKLSRWAIALDKYVPGEKQNGRQVPQGFAELSRWVMLARFCGPGR